MAFIRGPTYAMNDACAGPGGCLHVAVADDEEVVPAVPRSLAVAVAGPEHGDPTVDCGTLRVERCPCGNRHERCRQHERRNGSCSHTDHRRQPRTTRRLRGVGLLEEHWGASTIDDRPDAPLHYRQSVTATPSPCSRSPMQCRSGSDAGSPLPCPRPLLRSSPTCPTS